MKKTAVLTAASTAFILAGCGGADENNNEAEEAEEVSEEPEVNMADNGEENITAAEEETASVLDQDIEYFNLRVGLIDESEWTFTYNPGEEETQTPEASVSGTDIELEGEAAVEEMEAYLADFYIDAASSQQEITVGIMETFDFNEEDMDYYNLSIDFPVQENVTDWIWEKGENNGEDEMNLSELDDDLS